MGILLRALKTRSTIEVSHLGGNNMCHAGRQLKEVQYDSFRGHLCLSIEAAPPPDPKHQSYVCVCPRGIPLYTMGGHRSLRKYTAFVRGGLQCRGTAQDGFLGFRELSWTVLHPSRASSPLYVHYPGSEGTHI